MRRRNIRSTTVLVVRKQGKAHGLQRRIEGPDVTGWRATLRLREWGGDVFRELADLLESVDVLDVQVRPARLEEAYARLSSGPAR